MYLFDIGWDIGLYIGLIIGLLIGLYLGRDRSLQHDSIVKLFLFALIGVVVVRSLFAFIGKLFELIK
jgi:hypothetical protein